MTITEDKHKYGIDLLRIMAMLMIVAHHFSLHSGMSFDKGSMESLVLSVMALGGKTGVNIFVLITGCFSSGKIRKEKVGSLFGCAAMYALPLTAIAVLTGSVAFSKKLLFKATFPLLFGETYWFIVTYLELYILIPLINKVVQSIDEVTYKRYLIVFTCLLCVLPSVVGRFIQVNDFGYNSLVWFVYLYCLGAYLKKTKVSVKIVKYIPILIFMQITACVVLGMYEINGIFKLLLECFADCSANAVLPLLIAIFMLLGFQNLQITRGKKAIRIFGSLTMGVYLFHDNVNFRVWMWPTVYQLISGIGMNLFVVNAILSVLLVFAVGSLVEICRKTAVEKLYRMIKNKRLKE